IASQFRSPSGRIDPRECRRLSRLSLFGIQHALRSSNESLADDCPLSLPLRQWETQSPLTILPLGGVEIQIGDGDFSSSVLVENPKYLPDDGIVLNLHAMAVAKHQNCRN